MSQDSNTRNRRAASEEKGKVLYRKEPVWYPFALIAPTMITLIIVGLIPFIYTAFISVHQTNYGQIGNFSGLENFKTLMNDVRFWNSIWVAVVFVGIAVPLEFMLGLVGALVLSQPIFARTVLIPFLFLPTIMAPIVVALVWKVMFAGSWGFLSVNLIEPLGWLDGTSIFSSSSLALIGLIFVDVWEWTPFMMLAFFAGMQSLPVNPYWAAAVDGANSVQVFFKLTLPMLTPLLAVIFLLRLIDAFKVFDTIFLLTNGGPGTTTESPSVLGYKLTFEFWSIGEASALAVIIWLFFFLFCYVFYHVAKNKLNAF